MKKKTALALALSLTLSLLTGCGGGMTKTPDAFLKNEPAAIFDGGDGTEEHPYVITTPEGLSAVRENLSAHYRLNADIDLSGADWTPIGAFTPEGDSDAERKIPVKEHAFTGVFDGGSHTVSNVLIHESDGDAVGLFACVRDAHIYNLTVDGASVDGHTLTGAVVGYAYNSRLTAVSLTGANAIVGHENEDEGAESVGGIIGGATNSLIDSCSAKANVVLPDNSAKGGILCGGLEATSVINGYATGTLAAGDGCSEIGAIAGGVADSEEITNSRSENVRITVGERGAFVGGMVGRIESRQDGTENPLVTAVSRCAVESAEISAGEDSGALGGVIGGGFPSGDGGAFVLTDCALSGATVNGENAEMVGGGV